MASCRNEDKNTFYPFGCSPQGVRRDRERQAFSAAQIAKAKAFCITCPVADDCLALALKIHDTVAIMGNSTPRERRHIKVAIRRMNAA